MKKKIIGILFVVMGVIVLTGCNSAMKEAAGTYKLEYSKFVGDPDTAKSTEAASLVLEADGTGKSYRNDTSYNLEWSIDGENVTVIEKFMGITIEYNGTLKDGKRLDLFNGDKTNALTNETVYNKE